MVIKTVLSLFPCSPTVCPVWLLLATNALPVCLNTLHANGITFGKLVKPDIQLLHIDGNKYQLADLGTKNVPALEATYKLSLIETPVIEEGLIVAQTP